MKSQLAKILGISYKPRELYYLYMNVTSYKSSKSWDSSKSSTRNSADKMLGLLARTPC